jgi:site-specific DNA-methyltransferase (adenine-specific)
LANRNGNGTNNGGDPRNINRLFYGDNLDVLRRHIPDESVDLVYLDPPFNSNATYNVLFAERDGKQAAAQIKAFGDTWHWDQGAARAYEEVIEMGGRVSQALQACRAFLSDTDMLAYLAMMAPRLVELRRVMKPTASIYLHCDPTASHYLKMLMDAVFGPENFRNEIIWKRTGSHNDARKYADIHDCILYYARTRTTFWNPQHVAHNERYLQTHYNRRTPQGRIFRLDNIIRSASMGLRPNLAYEYKGFTPQWGWRVVREKLEALDKAGRLEWVNGRSARTPYLVRFLDEQSGAAMPSLWDDIPPLNSQAKERLGYPTQKPEALVERIIAASSREGDVVLDPFCGCGTTIAAAEKPTQKRRWIGIDITHLAIGLIRHRLRDAYGDGIEPTYQVIGEPTSVPDAEQLARSDPYQFQWWALGLVGARPADRKKGADQGIDGRIYFHEGDAGNTTKQIILSVKAGKLHAPYVRDLRGVMEREKAAISVLLTLDEPTRAMKTEAASAGFYTSPWGQHPRLQIITVGELLAGRRIDMPPVRQTSVTYTQAPKATRIAEQPSLNGIKRKPKMAKAPLDRARRSRVRQSSKRGRSDQPPLPA